MKLLNIGSLNIDKVYKVKKFVTPGETAAALSFNELVGGKGLNQSVAASAAGMEVFHAGKIGPDGRMLKDYLDDAGVDTSMIGCDGESVTGHAVIQVNGEGQNCILLWGGANQTITEAEIDSWLSHFDAGDVLLLQNETSCIDYAITAAKCREMRVALNPSPITDTLLKSDLSGVDLLILNEVEGFSLTGCEEAEQILCRLSSMYPNTAILLTLGGSGSVYSFKGEVLRCSAVKAESVIDTTGAGDTFTGYFLAAFSGGCSVEQSMSLASAAAAISIGRRGAAPSVPHYDEVMTFLSACKPD